MPGDVGGKIRAAGQLLPTVWGVQEQRHQRRKSPFSDKIIEDSREADLVFV